MATMFCNRGRSHSFPELSKTRDQQNQPEDKRTETPKRIRSQQEEISSKRLRDNMESIVSNEEAGKTLHEVPVWAKMLSEHMSSVNEEVLDMRKELQLFKTEMNQRVGQVENDVKLQQFQCQTTSLQVTSLRKELAEINDIRNDLEKTVEEAKDRIADLEQYSRRNCLIFTGIKEAGEDETENTDEVILNIC